jgi:hypothetical protein
VAISPRSAAAARAMLRRQTRVAAAPALWSNPVTLLKTTGRSCGVPGDFSLFGEGS